MSDFGELCPLFSTGVFHEITFPNIPMTHISICANALVGTATATSVSTRKHFTFGRTVVVTGAFVKQRVKPAADQSIWLSIMTSIEASETTFAKHVAHESAAAEANKTWIPMTTFADKTFTSTDILMVTNGTITENNAGVYDIILRYKEK